MAIKRINTYSDSRFSPEALRQHGCFLVDGTPCEVRIVAADTAVVTGCPEKHLAALIESFRFNAPHITRFLDAQGQLLTQLPLVETFPVRLRDIQPSQFFVDEEKLAAVRTFVHRAEDVIVPVARHEGRFISLDGHTRLLLAFAAEAAKRSVHAPADMTVLSHSDYQVQWNAFCDAFIASLPDA